MNAESKRLQFVANGVSLAVTFDGKEVLAEKLDALFGLLAADMDRRLKQLNESAMCRSCAKNETTN